MGRKKKSLMGEFMAELGALGKEMKRQAVGSKKRKKRKGGNYNITFNYYITNKRKPRRKRRG